MKSKQAESILAEQLLYYRVGAEEYDIRNREMLSQTQTGWWAEYRAGYDSAIAAAESACAGRDVVEFAGGSGFYTEILARVSDRLTIVDSSPEALAISRRTVGAAYPRLEYVEADLFGWQPVRQYQVVFFAFWLCHVPLVRFRQFWETVDRALADGGEVTLVDTMAPAPTNHSVMAAATSEDHELFPETRLSDEVSIRTLSGGATFRIVRVLWERQDLWARLAKLGWSITFDETSPWLVGHAKRSR